ncbi:MFS transporter [Paraburkholderia sediminicola]|uniref:MFS transporter n=1 Tax=Paraburkholderia sediminicola TaxID=458836 RepID=UPI000FF552A2
MPPRVASPPAPAATPTAPVDRARGPWVKAGVMAWYGLLVLIIAAIFGSMDRQILVLLGEPMRQSLQMSDTSFGLLQGAGITLFAGAAAVPLGWLADRFGRRAILAVCVLIWSIATAACGFAQDFSTLFVAAAGLGLGEAGLAPIVFGLIPDIMPEHRRALANGIYSLAGALGGGLGMAASGALVHNMDAIRPFLPSSLHGFEVWRLAFLAVAMPGPVVALLILLIRMHPGRASVQVRGAGSGGRQSQHEMSRYLRTHRITLVSIFVAIGLASLGLAATGIWLPIIAARSFGATPAQIGEHIGAAFVFGILAGAAVGAVSVRLLHARLREATPMRVLSLGTFGAALAFLPLLHLRSVNELYLICCLQGVSLTAGTVLIPTVMQDITPVAVRSRAIALGSVVIVGLSSLSPVLVGMLSDALTSTPQALPAAVTIVGTCSLLLAAALFYAAEKSFVRTVKTLHPEAEL